MTTSRWRAAAAGATVVLSALIGAVTNIVTSKWNVALFVLLVALVVLGVGLQIAVTRAEGQGEQPATLRANASGGSRIIQAGRDVNIDRGAHEEPS